MQVWEEQLERNIMGQVWVFTTETWEMPVVRIGPHGQHGNRPIFSFETLGDECDCGDGGVTFGELNHSFLRWCWKCQGDEVPTDEDHIGLCDYCLEEVRDESRLTA